MLKKYEVNPYTVTDKVVFRNVDKSLELYVRTSASQLVAGLRVVQAKLSQVNADTSAEDQANVAADFAKTIFGNDQGEQLASFYNDPLATITACGNYFQDRLSKLITKAQKK